MSPLKVRLIEDNNNSVGYIPKRGTEYSAGLDLFSPIDTIVMPLERLLIKLNISIELPVGTFGHILPRSGLALKNGIHVGAGVIDCDYRGNVGVLLFNLSDKPFNIVRGDRIAQLVIQKYEICEPEEVVNESLSVTERGVGGFGSTGN
jgi:dUTP pyrophosphatase